MFISEYFKPDLRRQYNGEGYMVSVLVMAFGMLILYMSRAVHNFDDPNTRRFVVGMSIMACFAILHVYLICWRIKAPWYAINFMPPEGYIRGPI